MFSTACTRALALGVSLTVASVASVTVAQTPSAVDPADRAPFSLTPAELLAVVSPSRPTGLDVEVLLNDFSYEFDAQHRRTYRLHRVYRILTQRGVEQWGSISMPYAAWHQNKPNIRARVIHADGSEHWLSEATLIDGAPRAREGLIYSDQHQVTGPLPALRRDCVVELVIEKSEHQPLFSAGSTLSHYFDVSTYTRMTRLRVSAPTSVPLRFKVRGGGLRVVQRRVRGSQTLEVVQRDTLPFSEYPPVTDPSVAVVPVLHFSTGDRWSHVAKAYGESVDLALANFDATAIANGLVAASDTPLVKAQKIADYVRHQVRYTALELGERSIHPESPTQVLQRRYGDCKDLSTLMVALLRGAGLQAHVALLQTGPGLDTAPKLPGLGAFNHAIVHVAGTPAMWIDPTDAYAPVGTLPFGDQDRLALITSDRTTELTRITPAPSDANGYREVVEVTFEEDAKPAITETTTAWGAIGSAMRGRYDLPSEQITEEFKEYFVNRFGAKIEGVDTENVRDVSSPFVLRIRGSDADLYESTGDSGYATARPTALYSYLPAILYEDPPVENRHDDKRNQRDPRTREPVKVPVYINTPHAVEMNYQFRLPFGFGWDGLPGDLNLESHGIRVSRAVQLVDGTLHVTFRIATDTRLVTHAHVIDVQRTLQQFAESATVQVRYRHDAAHHIEEGKVAEGLALYRDMITRYPDQPGPALRYSSSLVGMHFGVDARARILEAARRHPQSAKAQSTLAFVHLFDALGMDSYPGADFAVAEAGYRRAIELDSQHVGYRVALAIVLQTQFFRDGPKQTAKAQEALALFMELRDDFGVREHDKEIMYLHLLLGNMNKLAEFAAGVDPSVSYRDILWVVSIAATQGHAAAERKAIALAPSDPTALLKNAVNFLLFARRYQLALDLLNLPRFKRNGDPQRRLRVEVEKSLNPTACLEAAPPASRVVYDWLHRVSLGQLTPSAAVAELRSKARGVYVDEEGMRDTAEDAFPLTPQAALTNSVGIVFGPCTERVDVQREGDYVRVERFDSETNQKKGAYLLVARGSSFALLGKANRYVLNSRLMMEALRRKRLPEARKLAEWVTDGANERRVVENRYAFADALAALTPSAIDRATEEELWPLAAALGVANPRGAPELRALSRAREQATAGDRTLALDYMLAELKRRAKADDLVEVMRALHETRPNDLNLWSQYLHARLRKKSYDGVDEELARVQTLDEEYAFGFTLRFDVARHNWDALREHVRERTARNKITAEALNNVAWQLWVEGEQLSLALEYAEASIRQDENHSNLHTIATIYAELGRFDDAARELTKAVDRNQNKQHGPWDLYTLGRVAEGLGFPDSARYAYSQIERPLEPTGTPWEAASARTSRLPAPRRR